MKLFGTDGVRGQVNKFPMTADVALRIAMAAARRFRGNGQGGRVVIGKDTRLSGYMIEAALVAGFTAMGMHPVVCGPVPTPAVATLTRSMRADLGVMISASHNPFQDNGIKIFGPDGFKISEADQLAIERSVEEGRFADAAAPAELGRTSRLDDAAGRYIEALKLSIGKRVRLDGFKVVIDCAHGAAFKVAPLVFWELGADVVSLGVSPNGVNINEASGAIDPDGLQQAVRTCGADLGVALDGDADRVLLVDETGEIIDGDHILALIAKAWARDGRLPRRKVVATVMSNIALDEHLSKHGINLVRTAVGDRHIVERMRSDGLTLGGEQSGHIILGGHATTGDGPMVALHVLAELVALKVPASSVRRAFASLPQCTESTPGDGRILERPLVQNAVQAAERRLGKYGRILVRLSGTEPMIRIMAEGEDATGVGAAVDMIRSAIATARCGGREAAFAIDARADDVRRPATIS